MRSMRLILSLLMIVSFVVSCSAGEDLEKQALNDEPSTENNQKQQTQLADSGTVEEGYDENDETTYVDENEVDNLPKIESLMIVSISVQDVRSGFKIEVSTNKEDVDITDYYRIVWMHNGEELTGETGITIDWGEDFKRGDKIKAILIPSLGNVESTLVTESEFVIPNSPPKIVSEPPLEIESGKFEYTVEAEDPDGDEIQFLLKSSPKGMTIEPASGLISWDFTKEKPGTEYNIEIVASDTAGLSYTQELTLTIPEKQPETGEASNQEQAQESLNQ